MQLLISTHTINIVSFSLTAMFIHNLALLSELITNRWIHAIIDRLDSTWHESFNRMIGFKWLAGCKISTFSGITVFVPFVDTHSKSDLLTWFYIHVYDIPDKVIETFVSSSFNLCAAIGSHLSLIDVLLMNFDLFTSTRSLTMGISDLLVLLVISKWQKTNQVL